MSTQARAAAALTGAIRRQLMIAEGEARAAGYFLALFFLLGAGFALGRGSAGSLFLQRFGVAYLPQVFVALSAGIAIASFAYAAIADRIRPDRLLVTLLAILLGALLPLWAVMQWLDLPLAYPAYFVLFQVFSEILLLQVTLYFGMSFDNSQSKRLLPIAFAGMQAGEMCGGLGLTALASSMPMHHVALLWGLLLALAAVLAIFRHTRGRAAPHMSPVRKSIRPWRTAFAQIGQGLRFTRTSALLRRLALATLFTVIAVQILEYCTLVIYARSFRSEAELGIVFGLLTFVCGAVTLLLQLFFSGKLLRRFGVRAMNLVFPFSLLAAFAVLAASFRVLPALAGSIAQRTLLPALRNPSRALLFQALPDHIQGRARALSLAVVVPAGILIAAFAARAVASEHQAWLLPLFGFAAALGYLGYSYAANASYPGALLDTLGEKVFVERGNLGRLDPVRDRALLEKLIEGVRHADDAVALAHAHALAQAFPSEAWRYVLERMNGATPATRDQLTRIAVAQLPAAQWSALRGFLLTADNHQRATILSALFASRDPEAKSWVAFCLQSDNPRLVACGVQGAFDYPMEDLLPEARALWRGLLASGEAPKLLAGLELARTRPERESVAPVLHAHAHAEERVRRAALATLERHAGIAGGALASWAKSHLNSGDPEERAAALHCALDIPEGERAAHALTALSDPHPKVSSAAIQLLAEQHGAAFSGKALDWLADDTLPCRAQRALLNWLLDYAASERWIAGYAMRRAEAALTLSTALRKLRGERVAGHAARAHALLSLAVEESTLEYADLALFALEGIEDRTALRRVRAAIASKDTRHLSRAVESLEGLRRGDIALALRRTLENIRGDAPLESGSGPKLASFAQIADYLSQYPDAFLRECARYAQRVSPEMAT